MKKFLCLPGYLQSGKVFAEKTLGIRKLLSKHYTLDYVDPPMVIKSKEELVFNLGGTEEEQEAKWADIVAANCNRCWFRYEHDEAGSRYVGFDDSMKWLTNYIKENGPYQGIFGFSQGAAVTTIVTNTIKEMVPTNPYFSASIAVSTFAFTLKDNPGDEDSTVLLNPEFAKLFTPPSDLPTQLFFIYGSEDQVVPASRSKHVSDLYNQDNVEVLIHDGGHYVPNKKPLLKPLVEKIQAAMDKPESPNL